VETPLRVATSGPSRGVIKAQEGSKLRKIYNGGPSTDWGAVYTNPGYNYETPENYATLQLINPFGVSTSRPSSAIIKDE